MDKTSKNTSRRKILKLIGGSTVGLVGLPGMAAAEKAPTELERKGQGKHIEVPDDYENLDSFVVYEGKDLDWNITDGVGADEISTQSHCPSNDGFHWVFDVGWKGINFSFNWRDCPHTCEWNFTVGALGQEYGLISSSNCEVSEGFEAGVKPLWFEGSVEREPLMFGSTILIIVSADVTIHYYNPLDGWKTKNISFDASGEA